MKSVKSLLAIVTIAVLMMSCAATQRVSGDEYDEDVRTQQSGNRLYVQDPFYGTVVLERDPFTGRYYDVTNGYRSLNSPYNGFNTYRRYGNYNRSYRNYPRNYGNRNGSEIQRPSQEPIQKNREEARKKVLGNSN